MVRTYAYVHLRNGKRICRQVNPKATWIFPLIAFIGTILLVGLLILVAMIFM